MAVNYTWSSVCPAAGRHESSYSSTSNRKVVLVDIIGASTRLDFFPTGAPPPLPPLPPLR